MDDMTLSINFSKAQEVLNEYKRRVLPAYWTSHDARTYMMARSERFIELKF